MPRFLSSSLSFPNVEEADENGLLAIGGDLSSKRLLLAYGKGIFPWYEDSYPVLWWSPDPRMVLFPEEIRISHSLNQRLKKADFEIRIDSAFAEVIQSCASIGDRNKMGTWITAEMIEAYTRLHDEGFAHSIETWRNGRLIGGLYGVSLGKAFFGESMFFKEPDASKIALVYLAALSIESGFHFIDVQQETNHMKSMGARAIPRPEFIKMLKKAMKADTIQGKWTTFDGRNQLIANLLL